MDEELDPEEPMLYLYVEKSTNYIYVVQMFDDFVLFRPATPGFETVVRKMTMVDFADKFEEFGGNYDEFNNFVRGHVPWDEQPLTVYRR
jgi:hypothetical protein